MPSIVTDAFDYNNIIRVLDLDERFVYHQMNDLLSKYWRILQKTKPKVLKIYGPVMVKGNRGIDYLIYMLSCEWVISQKQRMLDYMCFGLYFNRVDSILSDSYILIQILWQRLRSVSIPLTFLTVTKREQVCQQTCRRWM
jgi:hypothetical protein